MKSPNNLTSNTMLGLKNVHMSKLSNGPPAMSQNSASENKNKNKTCKAAGERKKKSALASKPILPQFEFGGHAMCSIQGQLCDQFEWSARHANYHFGQAN